MELLFRCLIAAATMLATVSIKCSFVSLQCCVFVNVSPDIKNVVETMSSLQFGSSVRQISLGKPAQNLNKVLK